MKRMILALFAGVGLVLTASADEPAKPATTATTTVAPIVVSESTTPARRGIFSRIRERRNAGTVTTAPVTGTIVTPTTPTTPAPSTVPAPLPSVKPASGTTTTVSGVTTAAYTTPAAPATRTGLFSRLRTRGTTTEPMTMPMDVVVPASGTMTPTPVMTETPTGRTGIIARLRARRG